MTGSTFCSSPFKMLGLHRLLAGEHLIGVALNRVDLTVMYDKTVRMRSLPARIRVRGETGMHGCNRRLVILIL